jgi:hypothetical protein
MELNDLISLLEKEKILEDKAYTLKLSIAGEQTSGLMYKIRLDKIGVNPYKINDVEFDFKIYDIKFV